MKLLAYCLILPAIWLNTVFGNQQWYPTIVWLGQVFYWVSLLLVAYVIIRAFGTRIWPYALLGAIVLGRLAMVAKMPGAQFVYFGSVFTLFAYAGVLLAIDVPETLERQSRMFFLLSVPVMILQVAGVAEWLHAFNTLYAVVDLNENIIRPTIRMVPTLFTSRDELFATRISDYENFFSMQVRPPGLTHSSAMLAFFILAGAALYFGRMKGSRATWDGLILVSVVALSGAKLALLGFVLIALWSYLRSDAALRRRIRGVAGMFAAAILLMALVFPAALRHNLGIDTFETSFFIRGADALLKIAPEIVWRMPAVLEVIDTYQASHFSEETFGKGIHSGIATLFFALPILAVVALLTFPWILRGIRHCRAVSPETVRTAGLMAIAVLLAPLATPVFGAQMYALCTGIAFMPAACGFSARLRRRVVRAAQARANPRGKSHLLAGALGAGSHAAPGQLPANP